MVEHQEVHAHRLFGDSVGPVSSAGHRHPGVGQAVDRDPELGLVAEVDLAFDREGRHEDARLDGLLGGRQLRGPLRLARGVDHQDVGQRDLSHRGVAHDPVRTELDELGVGQDQEIRLGVLEQVRQASDSRLRDTLDDEVRGDQRQRQRLDGIEAGEHGRRIAQPAVTASTAARPQPASTAWTVSAARRAGRLDEAVTRYSAPNWSSRWSRSTLARVSISEGPLSSRMRTMRGNRRAKPD